MERRLKLRLVTAVFVLMPFVGMTQEFDLVLMGGRIVDGTGNPWFYGDVGVKNGKIAFVGKLSATGAARVIDAKGLIIAPGFIDVHAHIERNVLEVPTADNFIFDGVTSVVTGNCGGSPPDLSRYFFQLDSVRTSINVASLIGHNSVRNAVMGSSQRDPRPEELAQMEELVESAMRVGAVGISTGLIYTPGTYSKPQEVIALAKAAAKYNGVYASHIRSEGDHVTEAIE